MKQKSYDRIMNFSTEVKSETTISEIERMLAKYGATKIMKEYDSEGIPESLAFMLTTSMGLMPIRLPIKVDNIMHIFENQAKAGKLPKSFINNKAQAYRVGWRTIKYWLEAQITLINIGMTKPEEVLLPYIYNPKTNQSMFDLIEKKGIGGVLQLEDRSSDGR